MWWPRQAGSRHPHRSTKLHEIIIIIELLFWSKKEMIRFFLCVRLHMGNIGMLYNYTEVKSKIKFCHMSGASHYTHQPAKCNGPNAMKKKKRNRFCRSAYLRLKNLFSMKRYIKSNFRLFVLCTASMSVRWRIVFINVRRSICLDNDYEQRGQSAQRNLITLFYQNRIF